MAGSSPIVPTKLLIITAAIDTHKGYIFKTIDIVSALLHTNNEEKVLMKLFSKIIELLVQLKTTMYQKYVTTGPNGEPVLNTKLQPSVG